MISDVIWVVIFAVPPAGSLEEIFQLRDRLKVDVMYENRHNQAQALKQGDRVVVHYGGPRQSSPLAQHLVRAGCVKEVARAITPGDERTWGELLSISRTMFPFRQITGIMFYEWFAPTAEVGPLLRPYSAPKRGANFIKLTPESPAYHQVDQWWHRVIPKGHCGQT